MVWSFWHALKKISKPSHWNLLHVKNEVDYSSAYWPVLDSGVLSVVNFGSLTKRRLFVL